MCLFFLSLYLSPRYALYTKTALGYMYYKRQMRKAREQFPAGHSAARPTEMDGVQQPGVHCLTRLQRAAHVFFETRDAEKKWALLGWVQYGPLCFTGY